MTDITRMQNQIDILERIQNGFANKTMGISNNRDQPSARPLLHWRQLSTGNRTTRPKTSRYIRNDVSSYQELFCSASGRNNGRRKTQPVKRSTITNHCSRRSISDCVKV